MVILDSPSEHDVRMGKPGQWDLGRELDKVYLPAAGLTRDDVYLTTAVKCFLHGGVKPPTDAETDVCAGHSLFQEINTVRPDVIVTMGGASTRLFHLGLGPDHGIPAKRVINPGLEPVWVFPTYSPGVGLGYSAESADDSQGISWMNRLLYDMQGLGDLLRTGEVPVDRHPDPDYRLVETPDDYWDYIGYCLDRIGISGPAQENLVYLYLGADTESDMRYGDLSTAPPWCATLSGLPGTGIMVMADNRRVLDEIQATMDGPRGNRALAVAHNIMHDWGPLGRMGINCPRFVDTLALAFTLGIPQKGLKYLSRRLLGATMLAYDDVVKSASLPVAKAILVDFLAKFERRYSRQHALKSGPRKGLLVTKWLKASEINDLEYNKPTYNKVARLVSQLDGVENREPDPDQGSDQGTELESEGPDPWKRWAKWAVDTPDACKLIVKLTNREWESPSIVHADPAQALEYACRDADMALRLLRILRIEAVKLRRKVRPGQVQH